MRVYLVIECQDFDTWENHQRLLGASHLSGTSDSNSTLALHRIHRKDQCSTVHRWNAIELLLAL